MGKRQKGGITIKIGTWGISIAVIAGILESIVRADLMYLVAMITLSIVLTIGMILSIIPLVNIYVLTNIQSFVQDMFFAWGLEEGLGSAIVYFVGFVPMLIITVFVDGIILIALLYWFAGNKGQSSTVTRKIKEFVRL